MDSRVDIPLTPPYARDPAAASAAVTAGANPSMGSSGFASAGAPPTTGLTRGLFMAPRTTSAAGGGAPAPAVKPRAPFSKLQMRRWRRRARCPGRRTRRLMAPLDGQRRDLHGVRRM
ncbi:hypothetical protein D1007_18081 [Hordeum vulgare]|nr:hypothetical protein D1007_18081 [Hordeum vulgare]